MNFALETLEAFALIKERYPEVGTTCGVGNLTNGLAKKPYMRKVLTSVFLDEARKRGLDSAIINPNHYVFVQDLEEGDYQLGLRAVLERDMDAFAELEEIAERKTGGPVKKKSNYDELPLEEGICARIKDGHKDRQGGKVEYKGHTYEYKDRIVLKVVEAMDHHEPLEFINVHLMGAMQELGDGFGRGEVSLPHLLKAADVMRQAMGFLEAYMRNEAGIDVHTKIEYKGTVVLGTVYQDVHSIGKDLARTLLENYGYRVIDLGTMTPLQDYIDVAKENNADAIGMSALLVQTSNHMITVAKMMEEQGLDLPILIGGAPVSDRHAAFVAMRGHNDPSVIRENVFYCRTAMDGVNIMNKLKSAGDLSEMFEQNKVKLLRKLDHARQREDEEKNLFETLPRREVPSMNGQLPDAPRFRSKRYDYTLRQFGPYIDKRNLYSLNWKFGGTKSREKAGHTAEHMEALFEEWVRKATDNAWVKPQGVFGVFPCVSDGDSKVTLFDPEDDTKEICTLDFTTVIGAGKKDLVNAAQYFPSEGRGAIGIQITTSGPQVDEFITAFREAGESESTLYLQGLSDRIAEDMAEHLHNEQRALFGLEANCGQRWSPGYPGMRNMDNNRRIFEIMNAGEMLGVKLTDADEFSPTGTTAAVVSYHPDARYT
jgi:5-methyltetrahydrofolate--homocysteine methyltransferase